MISYDSDILSTLARWLRESDCPAFAGTDDPYDQDRAAVLGDWFAGSVDVLNVPPRPYQSPFPE